MTNPITVNSTKTVTSIIRNGTAIEKMMLAWEWQPQGLFLGDVQAAWYDPIDTANDDWRRNLLTFSEQFDNAVWGNKQRILITPNAAIAPDGTMTADKLISSTVSGEKILGQNTNLRFGQVMSVYAKAAEISSFTIFNYLNTGSRSATFDLVAGSVTSNIGGVVGSIEPLPDGWYRCIARYDGLWTESTNIRLPTGTGNDVDGIFIWGAQLELGPTATAYQRITDVDTEVRALFPNTTMFQSSVAAPNAAASSSQTTGLWLDKSKLLALGPDLVNNGTFTTATTGWAGFAATLAINNSRLQVTPTDSSSRSGYQNVATVVGKHYKVTAQYDQGTTTGVLFRIRNLAPNDFIVFTSSTFTGVGTAEFSFVAGATSTVIELATATGNTGNSAYFDNVSIREITGNHALQTSTSLRPLFGRSPVSRRNMFTFSESFDNAAWTKSGVTVTKNAAGSSGTSNTAWTVASTSTSGQIRRTISDASLSTTYTYSVVAKAGTANWLLLQGVLWTTPGNAGAWFNLTDGTIGTVNTGYTAAREAVGNGFYRCSITFTTGSTDSVGDAWAYIVSSDGNTTTSVGQTLIIQHAQFEAGSVATPYQKVVSALDVTESGVPSYAFIRPDLSDDKLTTNMASTKNLLRYTEEFDNAAWSKSNLTAVGTLITETAINGFHQLSTGSGGNVVANIPHTYSFEVKPSGRSHINVSWANNGSHYAAFSLSGNGAVLSNQTTGIGTIALLADGYYRITYTNTPTIAGIVYYGINLADGAYPITPVPSYLGDVTKGVFIRNAQIEASPTATTYEYGGFKGDIIVAGKNGTAYETNVTSPTGVMDLGPLTYTGGTPGILRAVGDVVGYTMARKKFTDVEKAQLVRYYKKRGAKGLLVPGPELVTNGTFNTDLSNWTLGGRNQSWVDGSIELYDLGDVSDGTATQNITMRVSGMYILSVSVIVEPGAYWLARVLDGVDGGVGGTSFTGTYTSVFKSSQISNRITLLSAYPQKVRFDNVSIKELRPEEEW